MSATRDLAHAQEVTVPTSPPCHRLIPRLALRDLVDGVAVPAKAMRLVAALFVDVEGCARLCEDLTPRRMNEVIETIREVAGPIDVVHLPTARGDVRHTAADTTVAREGFGYVPRVALRDGLEQMVASRRDVFAADAPLTATS